MTSRRQARHQRLYQELTACWTYERFRHRLERGDSVDASQLPASRLEEIHARLRSVQDRLGEDDREGVATTLDEIEHDLRQSAAELLAQDSRISASDLRRFLTRVRRLDEEVLLGLLRFYVGAHRDESWDPQIVDKVDFLLSRLGEEISGPMLERDLVRLRASLQTLGSSGTAPPPRSVLSALRRQIQAVRGELDEVESLDALEESRIIPRYRRLKHGLGRRLVEPSVAEEVLRTNAALSLTVSRLHAAEEWRIVADFARVRELEAERGLPEALSLEIESLRRDMEVYEEGRRWGDVRLDTLHRLRRELRNLQPQITALLPHEEAAATGEEPALDAPVEAEPTPDSTPRPSADPPAVRTEEEADRSSGAPAEVAEARSPTPTAAVRHASESDLRWDLVGQLFQSLESVVQTISSPEEVEDALRDPGLPFDLEQRELEAFLALREREGSEVVLDRLIFTAAAVRHRLDTLRQGLEVGEDGRALHAARQALRLAESLLEELEEAVAEAETAADDRSAAALRFLRVRLMRQYAELWLEVRGAV
ncbi:MAG: hypothetical protein R3244_02355 [Thermoanaerobaculia bacterium]|nr:hypothetical protein [Thermoanaerobaculia bacterium]